MAHAVSADMKMLLLAVAAASCAPTAQAEPAEFERPDMVRYHMRQHFNDLRTIEKLLLAGELDAAKALAYMLTLPISDPGMARWTAENRSVALIASELSRVRTIDEGLRTEARIGEACAGCHVATGRQPIFATPSHAPREQPTVEAQMARHQWAVDRLWEGLVAGSDTHWRAGLYVVAMTPPPFAKLTAAPKRAAALQKLARKALETYEKDPPAERARQYGELLVTCAGCHKQLRPSGDRSLATR